MTVGWGCFAKFVRSELKWPQHIKGFPRTIDVGRASWGQGVLPFQPCLTSCWKRQNLAQRLGQSFIQSACWLHVAMPCVLRST